MPAANRRGKKSEAGGPPRIVKGGSSEFAYRILRDEIVSLSVEPGVDLDEASIVSRLGLSRTPVREALVRLAGEGLVQLLPNRGARVSPMGWNDIREHLEAFDVAQRLVTRWAAVRRTEENLKAIEYECIAFEAASAQRRANDMLESNWRFHAAIAAACRNKVLEQFYLQLLTGNLRISRLAMTYQAYPSEEAYKAHVGNILREHREIVDAIKEGDADRAEVLARSHANLARKRVSETLTQSMTAQMDVSLDSQPEAAA